MIQTQTLWQEFLKVIYAEVGSMITETWFKSVVFVRWDSYEKVAFLQAPNSFVKDWLVGNYIPLFRQHLGRLLNERDISIRFLDGAHPSVDLVSLDAEDDAIRFEPATTVTSQRPDHKNNGLINQNYAFDNFIVGPHNSLAYAAAHAVTKSPGVLYNPLIIYGPSGFGKTHLLHAIGNEIRKTHTKAVVLYQSADRFVNEFVHAVRSEKMYQFQARYKNIDVFLFDDLQGISHKEQTQEAFFTIFNSLYQSRKQIVCSSEISPRDIQGIGTRMRSRLESGLIVDVQVASIETKIAILKKKALQHSESLSDDIALFIASKATSNICELEGALIRVMAFASLTKQEITLDVVQKVLASTHQAKSRPLELHDIATRVAKFFDYSLSDLKSTRRHKDLVIARHVSMYLMKKYTTKSLREIGMFLDRRDHTTVLHALDKIEHSQRRDASLASLIQSIESGLCV